MCCCIIITCTFRTHSSVYIHKYWPSLCINNCDVLRGKAIHMRVFWIEKKPTHSLFFANQTRIVGEIYAVFFIGARWQNENFQTTHTISLHSKFVYFQYRLTNKTGRNVSRWCGDWKPSHPSIFQVHFEVISDVCFLHHTDIVRHNAVMTAVVPTVLILQQRTTPDSCMAGENDHCEKRFTPEARRVVEEVRRKRAVFSEK